MEIKFETKTESVKPKLTVKDLKKGQLFSFVNHPETVLIKDDGFDTNRHTCGGYVWLGPNEAGLRGGQENYNEAIVLVEGHLVISVAK